MNFRTRNAFRPAERKRRHQELFECQKSGITKIADMAGAAGQRKPKNLVSKWLPSRPRRYNFSGRAPAGSGLAGPFSSTALIMKRELKELAWVEKELRLCGEQAFEFREYLHKCKQTGDKGTKNDKGDFNKEEMKMRGADFKAHK